MGRDAPFTKGGTDQDLSGAAESGTTPIANATC
jgi:hypothetical protein